MKKKKVTKIMSYLLTTAMIVGGLSLSPLATAEVMAATTKNVNLGTDVLGTDANTANAATIYYGAYPNVTGAAGTHGAPIAWRVIGYNGAGVAQTSGSGTATLLAADAVIYNQKFSDSNNNYYGSNLQTKIDSIAGELTSIEESAVSKRTLVQCQHSGVEHTGYDCDGITGDIVTNAVMWPLSTVEAEATNSGLRTITTGNSSWWWLRSPGDSDGNVAYVYDHGIVNSDGYFVDNDLGSVRPAFHLNLSSVLFSTASGASKSSSFVATTDSSATSWNLTLQDGTGFTATRKAGETGSVKAGTKMNITVTAVPSDNTNDYTQTSAMLLDSNNKVICYGQIKNSAPGINDDIEITIPSSVPAGAYTMKVFAEDVNSTDSLNLTDYASNMADISVTVTAATSPIPTPQPPTSSGDRKEEAYVNPLSWYYEANPLGSMCLIERQGPLCVKAFNDATPKEYKEAFSFNILLRENGIFKPSYAKKSGKFVLNIPKEVQKPGRKFILIGIDRFGNTKPFSDADLSDETFTAMLDVEGYAFLLIYTDN